MIYYPLYSSLYNKEEKHQKENNLSLLVEEFVIVEFVIAPGAVYAKITRATILFDTDTCPFYLPNKQNVFSNKNIINTKIETEYNACKEKLNLNEDQF